MPRSRQLLVEGYRARPATSGKVVSNGYSATKKPASVGSKLPKAASAVKNPSQKIQKQR